MFNFDCLQLVTCLTVDFIPFSRELFSFFFARDEVYHLSKLVRKGCLIFRQIYYQLAVPAWLDTFVTYLNVGGVFWTFTDQIMRNKLSGLNLPKVLCNLLCVTFTFSIEIHLRPLLGKMVGKEHYVVSKTFWRCLWGVFSDNVKRGSLHSLFVSLAMKKRALRPFLH
ncbi:hypothetical protein [Vibrio vulnificus YJ016]|uniref:Uncharacterized protein n=1 Tax=Vibrio vulnificus (strain YJ016) TaxID=196600 RepID=Q7MHG3_VIBVY|nr:hypothetical protein [Vibrio vulnificus YJ016]